MPQLAVTSLCQRSGIRNLDLAPDTVAAAETILQQAGAPAEWREKLSVLSEASRDYQAELVGDSLPLGLALTPDCEDQHAP